MDPISLILFIAIGGIMIGAGVHFIPVGGAPAAMATATGVGTGTFLYSRYWWSNRCYDHDGYYYAHC